MAVAVIPCQPLRPWLRLSSVSACPRSLGRSPPTSEAVDSTVIVQVVRRAPGMTSDTMQISHQKERVTDYTDGTRPEDQLSPTL